MIDENWKWFKISDIFIMKQGKTLSKDNKDIYQGKIPCINGGSADNGIMTYLSEDIQETGFRLNRGGCLSLSRVGNSGLTFYQKQDFFIGDNAFSLRLKDDFQSDYIYLFLSTILDVERLKYCYGRIVGQKKYLKGNIKLPATSNGKPDWLWMEDYVKNTIIPKLPLKAKSVWENNYGKKTVLENKLYLNSKKWKWFIYKDLFKIKGSKTTPQLVLEEYGPGQYPYITTQAVNNGVEDYYDYYTEKGSVFTIDSAVRGFCAYQEQNFSASDHVELLIPLFECNIYIALFLTTLIYKEQYRYNYGRKCNHKNIKQSKLKLPVTEDGSPDWQFMEDYIKSLPYSRGI